MQQAITRHFRDPAHCPYCRGADLSASPVEADGDNATRNVSCRRCRRAWTDVFSLTSLIDDRGQWHDRPSRMRQPPAAAACAGVGETPSPAAPPQSLHQCRATVVGLNAIGRQTALLLTAMGAPFLQLIDPGAVQQEDLAPRGYALDDLGLPRVEAVGNACLYLNRKIKLRSHRDRFRRSMTDLGNAIFCCEGSRAARQHIWYAVQDDVDFFADARRGDQIVRVLCAADITSRQHYVTTLLPSQENPEASDPTPQTVFTAALAAGLMLQQFSRHLRQLTVDADLQLNLLTSELTVI